MISLAHASGTDGTAAHIPEKDAVSTVQHTEPSSYTRGRSEEKRLLRKIDWHLLPAIWLLYLIAVRTYTRAGIAPNIFENIRLIAAPENDSIWTELTLAMPGWQA